MPSNRMRSTTRWYWMIDGTAGLSANHACFQSGRCSVSVPSRSAYNTAGMSILRRQLLAYRHRLLVLGILVLSTWLSLGLVVARWVISGHRAYGFLIWNLFLAWI